VTSPDPPAARLRAAILAAADAVESARDDLGRLDAVAGDGDHGLTMTHGARAVRQAVDHNPDAGAADLLARVAMAMGSIGGTIGPIYAMALLKVAGVVRGADARWDRGGEAADGSGGGSDASAVALLRECAESGAGAITALGSAKPGDKTVLDALAPLVDSLRASEGERAPLQVALDRARIAALGGAAATTSMVAIVGRAARLGEQSRGSPDAGATSFAIIVAAAVGSYLGDEAGQSGA
jgi:dihydroxyacetone kinase